MNDTLKSIIKYLMVFVCMVVTFNLLLFLVFLIPKNLIEKHARESKDIVVNEGSFYVISETFKIINNTFTDAVIINEIYSADSQNPIESYLACRKNYEPGITKTILEETTGEGITANINKKTNVEVVGDYYDSIMELNSFFDGKITTAINYGRYWHGYHVLYRPLFILFNISGIRTIQLVLFVILSLALSIMLYKKHGIIISLIYFLSFLMGGFFSASYSLESGPVFLVMIITSLIVTMKKKPFKNPFLFFMIVGGITCYVDFLTVPIVTLFIPFSIIMLDYLKEHSFKECLLFLIKICFAWGVGYGATWISKWIIYDFVINSQTSMIEIGFAQSFYRMQRTNEIVDKDYTAIRVIGSIVWDALIGLVSAFAIIKIIEIIRNKPKISNKEKKRKNIKKQYNIIANINKFLYLIIATAPIAWYLLLANHTLIHGYFTYRMMIIFILGILLFINEIDKEKLAGGN